MKWRTTAIYFVVLVAIGAIYFFIDARQKDAELKEKEARRVFAFNAGAVKEIDIQSGNSDPIRIEKDENWRISQPIAADVDKGAFADFFATLQNIEQERKIGKPGDNLAAFGLDKPTFTIKLLEGSQWVELRIGNKNVDDTYRYARVGDDGDVFMLSSSTCDSLQKNLKDFRRKELFSWRPDEVNSISVKWRNGSQFHLKKQNGKKGWESAEQPDLPIKSKKVQNFLDDLHWVRAVDFAGKEAVIPSALAEILIETKDGKTAELKIADGDAAEKRTLAVCSEIEGPIFVPATAVNMIPKSIEAVADRSLIACEVSEIREIAWKTEKASRDIVWIDANTWGVKRAESATADPTKNSWIVKNLLSFVDSAEYIQALNPSSNPPEDAPYSVSFTDFYGKTNTLSWWKIAGNSDPVNVRLQKEGSPVLVSVGNGQMQRLNELLSEIMSDGKEGSK